MEFIEVALSGRTDEVAAPSKAANLIWVAETETTNEQFGRFCAERPYSFVGDGGRVAASDVSCDDATAYCQWMSSLIDDAVVRLPTRVEWLNLAMAGTTLGADGSSDTSISPGWLEAEAKERPQEVGQLGSNAWGLHDMFGNVSEWCTDRGEHGMRATIGLSCKDDRDLLTKPGETVLWLERDGCFPFLGFRPVMEVGRDADEPAIRRPKAWWRSLPRESINRRKLK